MYSGARIGLVVEHIDAARMRPGNHRTNGVRS
jgi:hypothetical protein